MYVFKIRHKPTGLYYQPVRGRYEHKTNLGKMGKIYEYREPSLNVIHAWCYVSQVLIDKYGIENYKEVGYKTLCIDHTKDDWEIVKYKCEETRNVY